MNESFETLRREVEMLRRAVVIKDNLLARLIKYCPEWDVSSIPDAVIAAEAGRRSAGKRDYQRSCECGECQKCKTREAMKKYRQRKKESPRL